MADEIGNNKEVTDREELERALSLLKPPASRIDRDSLLFLAGRASVEPVRPGSAFGRWVWPTATLLSSAAAVVLSVLLVTRPAPDGHVARSLEAQVDRPAGQSSAPVLTESSHSPDHDQQSSVVDSSTTPVPTNDETARVLAAETNYPRLRSYVLAYGIDALPEPVPIQKSGASSATDAEPTTIRELLRESLKNRSAG